MVLWRRRCFHGARAPSPAILRTNPTVGVTASGRLRAAALQDLVLLRRSAPRNDSISRRHCERNEAISMCPEGARGIADGQVVALQSGGTIAKNDCLA